MKLQPWVKFALIFLVAGSVVFGAYHLYGKAKMATSKPPEVPVKAELPGERGELAEPSTKPAAANVNYVLPGAVPANLNTPEIRNLQMGWNSQIGQNFAVGGPVTMKGSIAEKYGLNVKIIRQDDVEQMKTEQIKFAQQLAKGVAQPKEGATFIQIMGDGAAAYLAAVNPQLKKLCSDCTAEIVGSAGRSQGEDQFMAPPEVKENPQAARGMLVSGYLRDGDWNITMKWAGDNGICNNPNEKTYDPNCLNWFAANDYIDAASKYIADYCEERPVVKAGKPTGEVKNICITGVVTWTPGDVNVATNKGGLVTIVSTKDYRFQMPNALIGIKRWNAANAELVQNYLKAIYEGGDAVKGSTEALRKAAAIQSVVYKEADAAYWMKYYLGTTERDKQGLQVQLGGSYANSLADALFLFGLTEGSTNIFAATYKIFGDIVVQQYPELVPSYPPVSEAFNLRYLKAIAGTVMATAAADMPIFKAEAPIITAVSRRSWSINFNTGAATFTKGAEAQLGKLFQDLVVAGGLAVEVHGHTDNVGNMDSNQTLSERRAFAVKQWLEAKSSKNFSPGRVRVFAHGQTQPLVSNDTAEGKAQNRRVEIVLGATN